ncbi:serine hydrolase [Streptomyces sp. NPDC005389]|uniref:serine hydrolase n=1 Tax=Streptomyces sp. NPDC005389 TaxID=3157040 RepID=UPI0033AE9A61
MSCNSGFVIVGRVIEQLNGKVWDQALREQICDPLHLTHTSTLHEDVLRFGAAVGHDEQHESRPCRKLPGHNRAQGASLYLVVVDGTTLCDSTPGTNAGGCHSGTVEPPHRVRAGAFRPPSLHCATQPARTVDPAEHPSGATVGGRPDFVGRQPHSWAHLEDEEITRTASPVLKAARAWRGPGCVGRCCQARRAGRRSFSTGFGVRP